MVVEGLSKAQRHCGSGFEQGEGSDFREGGVAGGCKNPGGFSWHITNESNPLRWVAAQGPGPGGPELRCRQTGWRARVVQEEEEAASELAEEVKESRSP